jgi:hypothetical protein
MPLFSTILGCSSASFSTGAGATGDDAGSDGAATLDAANGSDAGATDGGVTTEPAEAGADAPPIVDFCASVTPTPYFCDAFDALSRPVSSRWQNPTQSGNGSIDGDVFDFVSPPRSAKFSLGKSSAAEVAVMAYERSATISATGASTAVRIESQFRYGASCLPPGTSDAVVILQVGYVPMGATMPSYSVAIALTTIGVDVHETGPDGAADHTLPGIDADHWHRLTLSIDSSIKNAITGADGASTTVSLSKVPDGPFGGQVVVIGNERTAGSPNDCTTNYDNFVWYQ